MKEVLCRFLILVLATGTMCEIAGCNSDIPSKPQKVPLEAFWVGGPDGGVWIDLHEVRADGLSATIYHETGVVWASGHFVAHGSVPAEAPAKSWLKDNISFFDGTDIFLIKKPWRYRFEEQAASDNR